MISIGKTISFIIGAILIILVITNLFSGSGARTVSLEVRNFTTNNTFYNVAYPITNDDLILYYFQNTTFPIPRNLYSATTTQVKIYANSTVGIYPNVTANSNYYYSYTWYPAFTVWGTSYIFIIGLVCLIVFFVAIYYLIKKAK